VLAIERDRRCIAALSELAAVASGRLELIEADALQLDVADFDVDHIVAVANLPYNIGTPLLLKWMDRIALFDALVLMFQREVAERLAAGSGSGA
jgi:16S rRNA (adenine1518-N6/adenine1519-N6)-dimethyltransferase